MFLHCGHKISAILLTAKKATISKALKVPLMEGQAFMSTQPILSIKDLPGPPALPVIGTSYVYFPMGPYYRQPLKARQEMVAKYGPVYREVFGKVTIVNVHNLEDIRNVFRTQGTIPVRIPCEAHVYYRRKNPHIYNTVGLSDAQGDEWLTLRRKVFPVMGTSNVASSFISVLNEVGNNTVTYLREARCPNTHLLEDSLKEFLKVAIESIWYCNFGTRINILTKQSMPESEKLMKSADEVFHCIEKLQYSYQWWKIWPTPTFEKLSTAEETLMSFVNDRINKITSKDYDSSKSLLQDLLRVKDLDFKDARVVALDNLTAGIYTTANFLTLLLHRLGQEPAVVKRLQEEIDTVLGSNTLTAEVLQKMPYTMGVIQEGYRLTTVIPSLVRCTPVNIQVGKYSLPANTLIMLQTSMASLDESNFTEAKRFIPERWMKRSTTEYHRHLHQEAKESRFCVLPYGFGSRMCIGRRLAEVECAVLLIKILRSFNISSEGKIDLEIKMILSPINPVSIKFSDR